MTETKGQLVGCRHFRIKTITSAASRMHTRNSSPSENACFPCKLETA